MKCFFTNMVELRHSKKFPGGGVLSKMKPKKFPSKTKWLQKGQGFSVCQTHFFKEIHEVKVLLDSIKTFK